MMSDMLKELMKQKAAAKKDPEFYAAQEELAHKLTWATMIAGGWAAFQVRVQRI
jgi:hypothetical protein